VPVEEGLRAVAGEAGVLATYAARVLAELPAGVDLPFVGAYAFSALNLALGVLLAVRRRGQLVPVLLAVAFVGTAATFNDPGHVAFRLLGSPSLISGLHYAFHVLSGLAYVWAVLLFPDGRLPGSRMWNRWQQWIAAVVISAAVAGLCLATIKVEHTKLFVSFFGVLIPLLGFASQAVRMTADGSHASKQSSRLLLAALAPAWAVAVAWILGRVIPGAAVLQTFAQSAFAAVFAVVPIALSVGILRYRIWNLDLVLRRALLTSVMVVALGVCYGGALALAGSGIFDRDLAVFVAMAVVALAVEPLRVRAERLANRVLYGQDLTPHDALRRLASSLDTVPAHSELQELVRIVVSATRASAAELWILHDRRLLLAASSPPATGPAELALPASSGSIEDCRRRLTGRQCLPVTHEGALVAVLALTVPPDVVLPRAEQRLLRTLVGHAGMLVANARLIAQLAQEIESVLRHEHDLRQSRRALVAAQDEQRRRLERDIHDGAQQELVALLVEMGTLERVLDGSGGGAMPLPQPDATALDEAIRTAESALLELCRGAPTILVERGLPTALESAAATARRSGVAVTVTCEPALRLPAEVEAAAYFCCLEALQNATKHAQAARIDITVVRDGRRVVFTVSDDGRGFDPSTIRRTSGLAHLVERVTAIGGTVHVESSPDVGTRIRCEAPTGSVALTAGAPL
jgi:signal transduction histidine kinase